MNTLALLLGVFAIPLIILLSCHRFRRLGPQGRRRVWGLVIGYGFALIVVLAAMLSPPVLWTDSQPLRTLLVYWGLLTFPLLGTLGAALTGLLTAVRRGGPSPQH
ncbi:hypothetical protein KT71_003972 [Congregibacter litoralis KT71]|uniref:Uncharacterized protein n=1 Tax=Congregibacter litoralis KT71 TaxID=314285 RepID=V7HSX5_9GAMM|nr:hypothetical protein KT71_003972 [Congregibacter litoralis KT71]